MGLAVALSSLTSLRLNLLDGPPALPWHSLAVGLALGVLSFRQWGAAPAPRAVVTEAALLLRPLEVTVPQGAAPWLWEPMEWTLPHVSSQRMAGLPSLQVKSGKCLEVDSSVAFREGGSLLCAWV